MATHISTGLYIKLMRPEWMTVYDRKETVLSFNLFPYFFFVPYFRQSFSILAKQKFEILPQNRSTNESAKYAKINNCDNLTITFSMAHPTLQHQKKKHSTEFQLDLAFLFRFKHIVFHKYLTKIRIKINKILLTCAVLTVKICAQGNSSEIVLVARVKNVFRIHWRRRCRRRRNRSFIPASKRILSVDWLNSTETRNKNRHRIWAVKL